MSGVFSIQSSCIRVFRGYNGEDMFRLKKKEMDRLIGQQEAQRLESQILVQKNKEGVISNEVEMMTPSKVTIVFVAEEENHQIKRFRNSEMRFQKINSI